MANEFAASTRDAICGIDPGMKGALAFVRNDGNGNITATVHDLPTHTITLSNGKRRTVLAIHDLAELLRGSGTINHVFIEEVAARPGNGVVSMFQFGWATGAIYTATVLLGLPLTFVLPSTWQRHHRIDGEADNARRRAQELHPAIAEQFRRREADKHRADAVLIAHYGLHLLSGTGRNRNS
jgi:crossover junction endodeoxyribonuclease RuvC